MSWDDLNAANYDWPTLAEVKTHRDTVRAVVDETIRTMLLTLPIHWDHPCWVILMGIEHQRIHIETSPVIIRRLLRLSEADSCGFLSFEKIGSRFTSRLQRSGKLARRRTLAR